MINPIDVTCGACDAPAGVRCNGGGWIGTMEYTFHNLREEKAKKMSESQPQAGSEVPEDNFTEASKYAGISFSQGVQFYLYFQHLLGKLPAPDFLPAVTPEQPLQVGDELYNFALTQEVAGFKKVIIELEKELRVYKRALDIVARQLRNEIAAKEKLRLTEIDLRHACGLHEENALAMEAMLKKAEKERDAALADSKEQRFRSVGLQAKVDQLQRDLDAALSRKS